MNGDEMWSTKKVWSGLCKDNSENTRRKCWQSQALDCELVGSPTIPGHHCHHQAISYEKKYPSFLLAFIQSLTHVWNNLEMN